MARIIRLTENDLARIVRKVIKEEVNATCTDGTYGTLKYQNNKYGIVTKDGGFCIVPSQTQGAVSNLVGAATTAMNRVGQMGQY